MQQQQALDVLAYLQDFLIDSKKQQAEQREREEQCVPQPTLSMLSKYLAEVSVLVFL